MTKIRILVVACLAVIVMIMAGTACVFADTVSSEDTAYTHDDLKKDVKQLTADYPEILHAEVAGTSVDGRELYCLYLGNQKAERQIFVTADLHAREYINGQMVMQCLENYCRNYRTGSYKGLSYQKLFGEVCVVIMPMTNPDGVEIAVNGPSGIRSGKLRKKLKTMSVAGGYSNWQANAHGVDLNRNFGYFDDASKPQYAYFSGSEKYSEPETWAILKSMDSCSHICAFLNIHSMGKVIYYGGTNRKRQAKCKELAKLVQSLNGYSLENESAKNRDHGDLEHYIAKTYQKPYVCIETGRGIPVSHDQLAGIYDSHKDLFAAVAKKYMKEKGVKPQAEENIESVADDQPEEDAAVVPESSGQEEQMITDPTLDPGMGLTDAQEKIGNSDS